MPYCPECGAEYRKGFLECSECGVELVEDEEDELFADDEEEEEDLLDEAGAVEEDEELLELYSGPPYAATIVANALKDRGIASTVLPDAENSLLPPTESSVFITEEDYNKYEDLIQECLELVEVEPDQGVGFGGQEE